MPKKKTQEEVEVSPDALKDALKNLLQRKAKDIFEREPQNAFVPKNLDNLVDEIISLVEAE